MVQPRAGGTGGGAGVTGARHRADRGDRQLPGPLDGGHRSVRPGRRRDRRHRPPCGQRPGPAGDRGLRGRGRGGQQGVPGQPGAGRGPRPGDVRPQIQPRRPGGRLRPDRHAAHRRCPPFRAGQRRYQELGSPGQRRGLDAGPRLVLVGGGHAGPGRHRGVLPRVALRGAQPVAGRVPARAGSGHGPGRQHRAPAGPTPVVRPQPGHQGPDRGQAAPRRGALGHDGSTWPY